MTVAARGRAAADHWPARRRFYRACLWPSLLLLTLIAVLPTLYLIVTSFTPLDLTRPETAWDFSQPMLQYRLLAGLSGNQVANILAGRDGDDRLIGKDGDDILRGGKGIDKLQGGRGDDILRGDEGRDTMTGGAGRDLFIFLEAADGAPRERITDFKQGEDKIALSAIDANIGVAGNQAFTYIGDSNFTAAGQLRTVVGGGDTLVLGDIDGDGRTDFRVFLTGEMTLTAEDFIL